MTDRTEGEDEAIARFLATYFPEGYDPKTGGDEAGPRQLTEGEENLVGSLLDEVRDEFSSSKGSLGLALAFMMIAEQISQSDERLAELEPSMNTDTILDRYDQAAVKSTLTLKHDGEKYGIRSVHEYVTDLFREELLRSNFPSASPHYTGEWERYEAMLEPAFGLSRRGRYEAAQRIFDFALEELEAKDFAARQPPFPAPFVEVLDDFPRSHPEEEGGLAFQALAYGYMKAEWPHLSIRVDKVHTGSSRQHRYGDIDGYVGPDLMVSLEVKDLDIDSSNVESELGTVIEQASETTAVTIALVRDIENDARETLEESDVEVITEEGLMNQLRLWDYHKQNEALQGMIHYIANVEQDPDAVQRLLRFVHEFDPENPAMAHLKIDREDDG
ncbi:hypothetical protein [Halobaculum roseum]|uniref:Restriction endonuclease n=1 Tax=Halobaculum roseum TaxID=2175149 RepID=A0ABD5MPG0_9EURY|nr:hypothetical protein [Halobaculum roseum]QZY03212.1 hypothetical protein K6T36_03240 [Halobaculum roseum]